LVFLSPKENAELVPISSLRPTPPTLNIKVPQDLGPYAVVYSQKWFNLKRFLPYLLKIWASDLETCLY
jgi:hypothetical protein